MALLQPVTIEMKEPTLKKRRLGATQMEPQLTIVEENPRDTNGMNESTHNNTNTHLEQPRIRSYPDSLTNHVISTLSCPPNLQVALDHANHKTSSFEVQAYAKLSGQNWTYFVQKLHVVIGRSSEQQEVDIDLGPAKVVSRKHASIEYNGEDQTWELWVRGRNGVKVDKVGFKEGHVTLRSGSVIDIGGVQMMFVLPGEKVELSEVWVDEHLAAVPPPTAAAASAAAAVTAASHMTSLTDMSDISMTSHISMDDFNHSFTSLADRVSPSRGKSVFSVYGQDQSHMTNPNHPVQINTPLTSTSYPRGVALISRPQIRNHSNHYSDYDLSLDDAKDIKPPYSYATMITKAILSGEDQMMTLAEIYEWISKNYSFYRHSRTGWQNSIRHNLSLNKAFVKVPRRSDEPGKGMKWQVTPEHKDEFLRKSKGGELVKKRQAGTLTLQRTGANGGGGAAGGSMTTFVVAPPPHGGEQICLGPSLGEGSPKRSNPNPILAGHHSVQPNNSDPNSNSNSNINNSNSNANANSNSNLNSNNDSNPSTDANPLSTPRKDQFGGVGFEDFAFTPSPRYKEAFTPDRLGSNISASRSTVNMGAVKMEAGVGGSSTLPLGGSTPAPILPSTTATPAPILPNLSLAPPSAQQQLPSSFMPASSPAPFWRFMQLSSTPVRGGEGFSPVKYSPSREGGSGSGPPRDAEGLGDLQNIDLTRGFRNWQDSPAKVNK